MPRWLALAALCTLPAAAQVGAPPPPPAAQAQQLPLSGRAPQAGTVTATQNSAPGAVGVNALTPSVDSSAAFTGSLSSPAAAPFSGHLSLRDAIDRGLGYNLGAAQWNNTVRQAEGQTRVARSALLPSINGNLSENTEQTDLKALGFNFSTLLPPAIASSFNIPTVVGPFSYMDLEASLTQSLVNFTAINNYRASQHTLVANQMEMRDARDLVVLGVGGAYLGVIAAKARLAAAQAQLSIANAILDRSQQQEGVGALARLSVDQNQVQASMQQLQITTLGNDLAKQKINLARMIGLPPTDLYDISDDVPFSPPPPLTEAAALQQALEQRADLKAADAQAEAARYALIAARDERLPSATFSGDYGIIGDTPWNESHGIFAVEGSIQVPLWQGGRVGGDIEQAAAAVAQRQAEAADTRSQIEAQVREAFLDLSAAAAEVKVAQDNLAVAKEAEGMAKDRFDAGVINTVELIQAQQAVATAEQDYINSVYAHNVAKLSLARALGDTPAIWPQFLKAGQ